MSNVFELFAAEVFYVSENCRNTQYVITNMNTWATEVVLENGVEINDLHAVTKAWDSSYYDDYCHFTPQANKVLGEIVANALKCKCERYCDFVRRYD